MSLNHDKTWDVFEGLAIFKSGWLYDEENYNVKIAFANVKISMHKSKNYKTLMRWNFDISKSYFGISINFKFDIRFYLNNISLYNWSKLFIGFFLFIK